MLLMKTIQLCMHSWAFRFKGEEMKHATLILKLIVILAFASSCTKSRKAELPEDVQSDILAISEFNGTYNANRESIEPSSTSNSMKAVEQSQNARLSSDEVNVPARIKFMFDNLPMSAQTSKQFEIKFLVDKKYVTAFKVVSSVRELTALENSLAMTSSEVDLIQKSLRASKAESKPLTQGLATSDVNKKMIKSGQKEGTLWVPIFKYEIESYGIITRTKNEMKEETAVLQLKATDFKAATHIKIKSLGDGRLPIGGKVQELDELFVENKIDNVLTTAEDLQERLKIGISFIQRDAKVFTRLDDSVMHVYELTTISELNENQLRLLKNNAGNEEVIACSEASVAKFISSEDKNCVLLLKADVPISYKTVELVKASDEGISSEGFKQEDVPRASSVGLVSIKKNSAAKQVDISGTLDPNSAIRVSDLKGEFFYRRTFESASNMFLGRTGTSGDMSIVKFELEDKRLVVRNQESLISYTGQGPKDREEIMSFPVRYIRMNKISATGAALTIPVAEQTTKEKAEYAIIDWTQNTVPNASSPLAFYADGSCFMATSSQQVTDTDMRLANDGVLNFSLSGSYTMQPRDECIAMKDVNAAYWAGTFQFNYNITERISFKRHINKKSDIQFALNISSMAQEAFNFGTFGLANKVTENGTLNNRDGSEKYMPIIHDFRNGKKLKYYLGGLDTAATDSERKQLLIEATKEVIDQWNKTIRYAFRGTDLERADNYVELVIDDGSKEPKGHLGDLDRNYIWLQELPAENGLLGVAQPAANPRSGTIESANVIVYTGNTLDQSFRLLKMTEKARNYEKAVEKMRQQAFEKAKATGEVVSTKSEAEAAAAAAAAAGGKVNENKEKRQKNRISTIESNLKNAIYALRLDTEIVKSTVKGTRLAKTPNHLKRKVTKELYKQVAKGSAVKYELNQKTFLKKISELAMDRNLVQNRHQFELAVNNVFMQYGGLDAKAKSLLQKRSEQLAMASRFDESNKNRPGCFMYTRNDANDEALMLDPDPKKNLMLNFKKNVMTTLSHELGHAFGLLHNFTGSTDKKNYEFPGEEKTGRNYSSIMDYMADTDQNYRGPGPYDAHAIRAAYTGLVEVTDAAAATLNAKGATVINKNLVSIPELMKALGKDSLVHFTKDTINKLGVTKHYAQCSDGGLGESAMCAQFDVGGSATEIVQNKIADYNRGYINRNYVYDSIIYNWTQKVETINRNIRLFQGIRDFLNEAYISEFIGTGRPEEVSTFIRADQFQAANLGYQFFHELIRTPDAPDSSAADMNRFYAVPYQFAATNAEQAKNLNCSKVETGQTVCNDIKILEARSVYDKLIDRDKMDTIGIGYDKVFAMQFLTQASQTQMTDDSQMSMISYLDFEQYFLGITDPSESLTIKTLAQVMSNQLSIGFFGPDSQLVEREMPVAVNYMLAEQTPVNAIMNLSESKWKGFDPFAESFKIGTAFAKSAPSDRLNVAKAGQDRDKSDSRVLFATQNSIGGDMFVRLAARGEALLSNKAELFKIMSEIFTAETAFRITFSANIGTACSKNENGEFKDKEACQAAQKKAIAATAQLKTTSDRATAKLIAAIRQLNANEAIMPKEFDSPESAANFSRQANQVRSMITDQLSLIHEMVSELESISKADQLEATIQQIVELMKKVRAQNQEIESVPLFSLAHAFMTEAVQDLKATLQFDGNQDGVADTIPATALAQNMMNGRKLQSTHTKMINLLTDLSLYTGLLDPETVIK